MIGKPAPFLSPTGNACNDVLRLTFVCASIGFVMLLMTSWWAYPVSAWLALLLYGFFFMKLLKIAPASALTLLAAFGIMGATQMISGIMIELGGFLSETGQMGEPTGGFMRLTITYIIFFGAAAFVSEHFIARWKGSGKIDIFINQKLRLNSLVIIAINSLIAIALVYLVIIGIKNGFPLLTETDRFVFRKDLDDPVFLSVIGNRVAMILYLGFMNAMSGNKGAYRLMTFCLFVVSALFGEKFTSLSIMLMLFFTPAFMHTAWRSNGLPIKRMFLIGVGITIMTLPLVFIVYGGLHNAQSAIDRTVNRMTLQGQLWFLADREVNDLVRFDAEPLMNDLRMMTAQKQDVETRRNLSYPFQGMAWMLLHFADPIKAYLGINSGVVFCLGLHAYLLEMLGWLGLFIANIFLGVILGLISSGIIYSIIHCRIVHLLVFSKFLTFWATASNMADLYCMFNWRSALLLIFIVVYSVFIRPRPAPVT
ncbi:MAG: DUF6418 domain-containing protein [Alphaproteobacteria bacterium]|nr:DUF6418 domain-containing protein [Alphaproteobacteria bacterium]